MKKFILPMIAFGLVTIALGQAPAKYKKSPSFGFNFIMKDMYTAHLIDKTSASSVLSKGQWTPLDKMSPGLSLSYMEGLSNKVDFMANLGGAFLRYPFSYYSGVATPMNDKFLLELDANVNLKLLPDNYVVVPYLSFGVGASMYGGTYFAAYAPVGVGLQLAIDDKTYLNTRFVYNTKVSALSVNHFTYTLGILSLIKEKKNEVVAAPPPPMPVAPPVVAIDSDKDGIIDSRDKCPNIAGTAKYDGCPVPDTDGDGINDENDKCVHVKGLPKYNGCPIPDDDKDGISNEEDKCPTVPGVARYQGCPIPDKDNDGINDEEDRCPDKAGVRENNGCPAIEKEVLKKVNTSAQNIFFTSGSTKLLPTSFKALNDVVAVLKEDANLKLDIEGHTDNTGSEEVNNRLSQGRAKAVYDYIISKGIEVSRISFAGYAASKPIADNKTAAGRIKNRRVEIKLKY